MFNGCFAGMLLSNLPANAIKMSFILDYLVHTNQIFLT